MCQRPSSTANPQSRSNPLPLTPTWARQTSVRDEPISRRLRASTSLWVLRQMRAQKALRHGPHTLKPEMILSPFVSSLSSAEIQRVLERQQSHCETAGKAWPSEADARRRWDWLCHTYRSGGNRWVSIIYIKLNIRSINKSVVTGIQEFLTSIQYHKKIYWYLIPCFVQVKLLVLHWLVSHYWVFQTLMDQYSSYNLLYSWVLMVELDHSVPKSLTNYEKNYFVLKLHRLKYTVPLTFGSCYKN